MWTAQLASSSRVASLWVWLLLSFLSTVESLRIPWHKHAGRAIVNVGPDGTCPAIPTVTVQVQPVLYSEFFPYNTVIDPFRNGAPFIVTGAPTTVIISAFLTTTIYPPST